MTETEAVVLPVERPTPFDLPTGLAELRHMPVERPGEPARSPARSGMFHEMDPPHIQKVTEVFLAEMERQGPPRPAARPGGDARGLPRVVRQVPLAAAGRPARGRAGAEHGHADPRRAQPAGDVGRGALTWRERSAWSPEPRRASAWPPRWSCCGPATPCTAWRGAWRRWPRSSPRAGTRSGRTSATRPNSNARCTASWRRSIGSTCWSTTPAPPCTVWYYASKHALEAFSDTLRQEVTPFGVRVVVVQPGIIKKGFEDDTPRQLREYSGGGPYAKVAEWMARRAEQAFQQDRTGSDPAVVARAIREIVTAPDPRPRYAVGQYAKLLLRLNRILPDRLFDKMVTRQT